MYAMTAAHPTLPIPSYVRVRNPANGREVVLRINDRGPFHGGRAIDLSYAAAVKLDLTRGVGLVEIQRITDDDIRSGAWRRDGGTALAAAAPAPADSIVPVVATAGETAPASAPPTVQAPAPAPPSTTASAVAAAVAVADAPPARAFTIPSRGFWVQLGAFRQRDGAEGFQQRVGASVDWLAPLLAVFGEAGLFKLQAGPYPSRDDARLAAERIRDGLRLVPVIVERR